VVIISLLDVLAITVTVGSLRWTLITSVLPLPP
jgi:hypothetical protein